MAAILPAAVVALAVAPWGGASRAAEIGKEVAIEQHLADGDEFEVPLEELLVHGRRLFEANWTDQEGGGRPLTKGTGTPLSDPVHPLTFPRNFNRVSAPDANSCAGCHNLPRSGGGGDIVANVFVLGHRFDFATFDQLDGLPTGGTMDETSHATQLQTIANSRNTLGMFGAGFIEMLARQMTSDLIAQRDALGPGGSVDLVTKGVSFGTLARAMDGSWITSGVTGLPSSSLGSSGPANPPNLIIKPFHQAGAVISLRQFSNNAFNHHHGIQTTERFGAGVDPDGDAFIDEMTRADVTAVSILQAQLAVPGRVIPRDHEIEQAVLLGEVRFASIGCANCHVPALPLDNGGWIFTEPNPFNPPGNLRPGDAPLLAVDLTDSRLDLPRLSVSGGDDEESEDEGDEDEEDEGEESAATQGVVWVPAYTDLKLHDITSGPNDPNREPLDMHAATGSPAFFAGNGKFLTRKLWGVANEPPFFHHGQYTTLRQAIEAHAGEAQSVTDNWHALSDGERDAVIEFLKTLQVLPKDTPHLIVDENGRNRSWPPSSTQAPVEPPSRAGDRHSGGPGPRGGTETREINRR